MCECIFVFIANNYVSVSFVWNPHSFPYTIGCIAIDTKKLLSHWFSDETIFPNHFCSEKIFPNRNRAAHHRGTNFKKRCFSTNGTLPNDCIGEKTLCSAIPNDCWKHSGRSFRRWWCTLIHKPTKSADFFEIFPRYTYKKNEYNHK